MLKKRIKFQNEYHRQITMEKIEQIKEWQKHSANLEEVLKHHRRREQQARAMEEEATERRKKELIDPDQKIK